MTINEYINLQEGRLKEIKDVKFIGVATSTILNDMTKRIFDKGINEIDTKIGSYDTNKPLYVNPTTSSPKGFPTKGKTGKSKFDNGNSHKTGYFKSYKDFKQVATGKAGFVNLKLFGTLFKDFGTSLSKVKDTIWQIGTRQVVNSDKIRGAEAKYGPIFGLTNKEEIKWRGLIRDGFLNIYE